MRAFGHVCSEYKHSNCLIWIYGGQVMSDWTTSYNFQQTSKVCWILNVFSINFSLSIQPLLHLKKSDNPFMWTKQCDQSFKDLKKGSISAPILNIVHHWLDFELGAVLLQ